MAVESGNTDFPWQIAFTITIRETAGLSVTVNEIQVLSEGLSLDAERITVLAGSNHVPARGSLDVPLVVNYRTESGGKR